MLACRMKCGIFTSPAKGTYFPKGLHLLPPAWATGTDKKAPEATCCLVSFPQWLPLLLTLFPLCLLGDAAYKAFFLLLAVATG